MADGMPYQPDRSLKAKVTRRVTQWRTVAPISISPEQSILSISFDDCPVTAATTGASILDHHQVRGTYYIATGLLGQTNHMGEIVDQHGVKALADNGHDIAAHTTSHLDCARASANEVLKDIEGNLADLSEMGIGPVYHFAYPFGETTPEIKSALKDRFLTARGILPGVNRGVCDRTQLRAFELDGSDGRTDRLISAIDSLAANPGWAIAFTHDVSDDPSAYGITPETLEFIVRRAQANGVQILPVSEAASALGMQV